MSTSLSLKKKKKKKKKSYLELKSQQIPYPSHQAHPSLHLLLSS